jgi:hypothetical protein
MILAADSSVVIIVSLGFLTGITALDEENKKRKNNKT